MRYGTYTCGLARGGLEYGYTFGEPANEVDYATTGPCEIGDTEFDVVLGIVYTDDEEAMKAKWSKYEWVAKAIIDASKLGEEVEVPEELT